MAMQSPAEWRVAYGGPGPFGLKQVFPGEGANSKKIHAISPSASSLQMATLLNTIEIRKPWDQDRSYLGTKRNQ